MNLSKTNVITGLVLATLHLSLVFCVYAIVVANGVSYATILWVFLAFIDLPVSFGLRWEALHRVGDYAWNNEVMPLLYFGTIGTAWWFALGTTLSALVSALRRRFQRRRK